MNTDRFKFRVWENARNCYLKDEKTAIVGDGDLIYGDMITNAMQLAYGADNSNIIVEQCTGLKDKNGNLIYIGDIIKCGNGPLSTATVQYENGENFIDGIYPFNLYHDCGDECHCQLRDYPEYACEIIGNIHEHKESQ